MGLMGVTLRSAAGVGKEGGGDRAWVTENNAARKAAGGLGEEGRVPAMGQCRLLGVKVTKG